MAYSLTCNIPLRDIRTPETWMHKLATYHQETPYTAVFKDNRPLHSLRQRVSQHKKAVGCEVLQVLEISEDEFLRRQANAPAEYTTPPETKTEVKQDTETEVKQETKTELKQEIEADADVAGPDVYNDGIDVVMLDSEYVGFASAAIDADQIDAHQSKATQTPDEPELDAVRELREYKLYAATRYDAQCVELRRLRKDLYWVKKREAELLSEKCDTDVKYERLTDDNKNLQNDMKILQERMAAVRVDVMDDPDVLRLRNQMSDLRIENASIQQVVARRVGANQVAPHADAIQQDFDIGDIVYVADEYWRRHGRKHPKKYDRKTPFVIVQQDLWQGNWILCAKNNMRRDLPDVDLTHFREQGIHKSGFEVMQMRIQKIYERGWLSDVEGHYLTALSGPPVVVNNTSAYWVDLRPQKPSTS